MAQRAGERKVGFPGDRDLLAGTELFVPNPVRLHEKRFASAMAAGAIVAEPAGDLVVTAIDNAHLKAANDAGREKDLKSEVGFWQACEAF